MGSLRGGRLSLPQSPLRGPLRGPAHIFFKVSRKSSNRYSLRCKLGTSHEHDKHSQEPNRCTSSAASLL